MSVGEIVSLAVAVIAGVWAVGKVIAWQFSAALDERFKALESARKEGSKASVERFARLEDKLSQVDSDLRKLLIEIPREYVRREDYVRSQSVIEGKLDSLALRIENALLKGGRRD